MYRKTKIAVTIVLALALCAFLSTATWSIPVTSLHNRHNMSSDASGYDHPVAKTPGSGGTDRICVFCHTPHSATPESTLWSRPDPVETVPFDLYAGRLAIKDVDSGSQYNSTTVTYPNGASRMCMSCHDGATAIGTVLGQPAEIAMEGEKRFVEGSAVVDLKYSHPISFVWDEAVATYATLWHDNNFSSGVSTGSIYTAPANYNIAYLDASNRMQCTTCHDPHEDPSRIDATTTTDFPPFWRWTGSSAQPCDQSAGECFDQVCDECHSGSAPNLTMPVIHNNSSTLSPLVPY